MSFNLFLVDIVFGIWDFCYLVCSNAMTVGIWYVFCVVIIIRVHVYYVTIALLDQFWPFQAAMIRQRDALNALATTF